MEIKKIDVVEAIAEVVYKELKRHCGTDKKVIRAGIKGTDGHYREMKLDVEGYKVAIFQDEKPHTGLTMKEIIQRKLKEK
jgi:hypothetical protein